MITEGSGADTKYYIQKGADATSKKQLGNSFFKMAVTNMDIQALLADTDIDYKKLTVDDFFMTNCSANGWMIQTQDGKIQWTQYFGSNNACFAYNSSTGLLSFSDGRKESGIMLGTGGVSVNRGNTFLCCDALKCAK